MSSCRFTSAGLAIALQASAPNIVGNDLIEKYHAPDLMRAFKRFLKAEVASVNGRDRPNEIDRLRVPPLSPHNLFKVWNRFALYHVPLPFAPDEPPRRDVVRARPATRNFYGRVTRPPAFDTVLYHDRNSLHADAHGLHRKSKPSYLVSCRSELAECPNRLPRCPSPRDIRTPQPRPAHLS
jgi:hypothetical protein